MTLLITAARAGVCQPEGCYVFHVLFFFLAHSSELIQSRGVRRLSVSSSVNTGLSPPVDEFQQRRRTTRASPNAGTGEGVLFHKNVFSFRQMAGL